MKKFLKKIIKIIEREITMFLISTWYVWLAAIIGVVISFIFNARTGIGTFFGIIATFIGFIWLRQIWWWVSGTGVYYGREGFLKKIWLKIFKNNEN